MTKLLIITSHVPLGRAIECVLKEQCAAILKTDIISALGHLRDAPAPDVILCDASMGVDVLRWLARYERTDRLVFMSGSLPQDVQREIKNSGKPILEKPFTAEQLREAVL